MATTSEVISVYGIPDKTPEEELNEIKRRNGEVYAYMVKVIEAEKINPDSELRQDYDGEARYNWVKRIASLDCHYTGRIALIDLFEKSLGG